MIIGIPKEIMHEEARVAATPETVKKYVADGHKVLVEKSAGIGALHADADYAAAGAVMCDTAQEVYDQAELILKVKEPQFNEQTGKHEVDMMHKGQYLITFIHPAAPVNHKMVKAMAEAGIISMAIEGVPRISRAQSMDALTSMSTCAGYKGILMAASDLAKFIPMMPTAAGMIKPCNVMVAGVGVAGLQALATALASTIGTGSIAGVAAALTLGGPGAIFWMWISAALGMMTGCAEKLLAVRYQQPAPDGGLQGGPMFYLRDGLGSPRLAFLFALAALPATLVGGNLIQSSSIASALNAAFGWNRIAVGAVITLLSTAVLSGGIRRIAGASSVLVPAMALLYLGCGGAILVLRAAQLPQVLAMIVQCAFTPSAAVGGAAGWTMTSALRHGVARGVFTNEAGLGTSAMAHGAARVDHPAQQGMWGIFEVFVSTWLVCTVTALVILVSGVWPAAPLTGSALTAAAFSAHLGPAGSAVVAVSLLLFAFSSILGWSYYGQQALGFLTGGRGLRTYRAVFLLCAAAGAVWEPEGIWVLVDLCNALMALPNLAALLLLLPQAITILNDWTARER